MKNTVLGIELGSTRIKSVLIDGNAAVIAQGSFEWKSELADGLWSYPIDAVERGLQASYASLANDYKAKTGEELTEVSAIGISAMMHGYLAFDKNMNLLVPFRTWQNTNTAAASSELSKLLEFNIPQRWSVSHYYQAILDGESHINEVDFLTTLAGYVHYRLTGKKVLGVGDASGMFPIDDGDYDAQRLKRFDEHLAAKGIGVSFGELLPKVLNAGENAGTLTEAGARFLDTTGTLKSGCPLCAPEGDAGTGMVATNSVMPRSANISAGTSAFLMAVLERPLSRYYEEIDMVTTPHGAPVAMVHVNNFTSEINAWADMFAEVIELAGGNISRGQLFDKLYACALSGDGDCGGLVGYNFLAGEPIASVEKGAPLIARRADGRLSLANFMKMHIYSALGALAMGCGILGKESVEIDKVCGHGGFFKSAEVSTRAMSAAVGAPVSVMKNAGEGGAWGIALLALYALDPTQSLEDFLADIFADTETFTGEANENDKNDFELFLKKYEKALAVERLAAESL